MRILSHIAKKIVRGEGYIAYGNAFRHGFCERFSHALDSLPNPFFICEQIKRRGSYPSPVPKRKKPKPNRVRFRFILSYFLYFSIGIHFALQNALRHGYPCKQNRLRLVSEPYSKQSFEECENPLPMAKQ